MSIAGQAAGRAGDVTVLTKRGEYEIGGKVAAH